MPSGLKLGLDPIEHPLIVLVDESYLHDTASYNRPAVIALPNNVAAVRPDLPMALRAKWHTLASPGTWFTGAERVAIAATARHAMALPPALAPPAGAQLSELVTRAARTVAAAAAAIDLIVTDGWVAAGLDHPNLAELIGVVARLSAVDRLFQALGLPLPDGSVLVVFWCVQPDGRGAERPGVGYVRVAMEP